MEEYHGPSKPVELVIMAGVAYYIQDKKKMVTQVMDWLKPGGKFIMTHIPPYTPLTKGQDPIRELHMFSNISYRSKLTLYLMIRKRLLDNLRATDTNDLSE